MNQAIRHVWISVVLLFLICFGSLSYIQFVKAESITDNPLNNRQLYRDFGMPRGAILVDGKPIAESVPTEDGPFEYQRKYNKPEEYAHLTGFYSLANSSTHLESELNDALTGRTSDQVFDQISAMFTGEQPEGASVELTIDGDLQDAAYDMIPDGLRATIVATNPKTGEILAMASKPSYDPNLIATPSTSKSAANMKELNDVKGLSPYTNPALGNTVAPGSSFKILDAVAGLESGEYDLDTKIDNPVSITAPGTNKPVNNFAEGICASRTKADMRFIFAQSCNTPFIQMGINLGNEPIEDVAERFGFDQQLQVPLKVAASHFPSDLGPALLGLSMIGQYDTRATPLQMNMVAMGIANDGVIMQPNLIKQITAPDLRVLEEFEPKEFSTATSKEVADQVTELMRGPVQTGTAMGAKVPGVDLAVKTGTAQIRNVNGTPYVNSWITGFAPADDPEVAITVAIEDVDYNTGHNQTAAMMKKMTEAVFNQ